MNKFYRVLYIIIGLGAMIAGITTWLGITELSQFSAACFAFGFGCMAFAEGIAGGK